MRDNQSNRASDRSYEGRWQADPNSLQGRLGDAINVVLYSADHNLRMIVRKLRLFYALVPVALCGRATANGPIA
jgi:hypothetical protein